MGTKKPSCGHAGRLLEILRSGKNVGLLLFARYPPLAVGINLLAQNCQDSAVTLLRLAKAFKVLKAGID